jgi:hypothetical protein
MTFVSVRVEWWCGLMSACGYGQADPVERCPVSGESGKHLLAASISPFDPERTLDCLDLCRKTPYARPNSIGGLGRQQNNVSA